MSQMRDMGHPAPGSQRVVIAVSRNPYLQRETWGTQFTLLSRWILDRF